MLNYLLFGLTLVASVEFCEFQRDGAYCDGPHVRHCINKYEVLKYSCVSGCNSGTCIGASLYCNKNPPGWYCDGNHRKLCGSHRSVSGYEYCTNGCNPENGECIGPPFTDCDNKNRGCECDLNGNINCCYTGVLMRQIKCGSKDQCINATCNSSSLSSTLTLTTALFMVVIVFMV